MEINSIRKWSSKVLIHFIHQFNTEYNSNTARYQLMRESSTHLRELVLKQIKSMQVNKSNEKFVVQDVRKGFFGSGTLDWEINGYTQLEFLL